MDDEARRREALRRYCVLDTPPEEAFDRLSQLAAELVGVPFASIALLDGDRCWIKSGYQRRGHGDGRPMPREIDRASSFLDAVLRREGASTIVVTDTAQDPDFRDSVMVRRVGMRFLLVAPLHANGVKIGVLCCADVKPRAAPARRVLRQLEALAAVVVSTLEERAAERARLEAAHETELLRIGLSKSTDAITIMEIGADGAAKAVFVNDAMCALTGYAREELVGTSTAVLAPPESDPAALDHFREALGRQEDVRVELLGRKKNGDRYWGELSGAMIHAGEGGRPSYFITMQRDITEAKRRRQEAIERERLMALGESVGLIGHWRMELAEDRSYWSPQVYRIFGVDPDSSTPTVDIILARLDPEQFGDLIKLRDDALAHGEAARRFRINVDGEIRFIHVRAVCEYDEHGAPSAIFGVTQDITERAAMEADLLDAKARAEAAAQAKAEFLANMTHELRTPLTAIVGFSELLNQLPDVAEPALGYAQRIQTASNALMTIVNDVLDFSKLESGNFLLEHRPFKITELLEEAASLVRDRAERKGVSLSVTVAEGTPEWLVGDCNRLRQVLLNLLSNAVKFTDEGSVAVAAAYGAVSASSNGITITVSDTGIGMSEQVRERLFDRFVQGDGSVSRRYGGTGLGLAISKRLVSLMGGEIAVASAPGQGSAFSVFVPLSVGHAPAPAPEAEGAQLGALLVLVADDADANRVLVTTMLKAAGVEVEAVANGEEALEAVQSRTYDLVLMDVQMPLMDGVEATRRIRALGAAYQQLPIIALTANVLPEQVSEYRAAGMDDHLGKPLRPADLLGVVARWAEPTSRRRTSSASSSEATESAAVRR